VQLSNNVQSALTYRTLNCYWCRQCLCRLSMA